MATLKIEGNAEVSLDGVVLDEVFPITISQEIDFAALMAEGVLRVERSSVVLERDLRAHLTLRVAPAALARALSDALVSEVEQAS